VLSYLWEHRIKPPFGSRLWFQQWAKRCWTFSSMSAFVWRTFRIMARGAQIGEGTVLSPIQLQGNACLYDPSSFLAFQAAWLGTPSSR